MEQSFVAWAKVRAHRLPQVKMGIGDDAALLSSEPGMDTVITSDTLMEGVHFISDQTELGRIGEKLVKVNLSDLAAMAAKPNAVFLSMCIPTQETRAADVIAAEIYEGVCQAAAEFGVSVAGGDTNCWDGPLVLGLTAVGYVPVGQAWTRCGAQPEDVVVVTGKLGGSLRGKHLDFRPRLDVAQLLIGQEGIHAAMDISDGLSVDLLRMCDASRCGAILDLEQIPIADDAHALSQDSGKLPVEHALGDGEDFELLLAIDPSQVHIIEELLGEESCYRCGEFTSRTGLWMQDGGKIHQLTTSGYVHGR